MRFFIAAGGWSYDALAGDISARHKTMTINTDTVGNWANHDVQPTIYRAALFRLVEDEVADTLVAPWRRAFCSVWAEHRARPKKLAANLNVQQND